MPEKWSINRLYTETDYDRRTIKRWLDSAGKAPCDVDGKTEYYTLRDFIEAAVENARPASSDGGENPELTRKTRLQADILEIDLAEKRNEVIPSETAFRVLENILVAFRRRILTSNLPQETKDDFLKELQQEIKIEDFIEQREFDRGTPAESAANAGTA
jgi:hypothetical protein